MRNPLDEHIAAFRTAMDAIKIARRVLDNRKNPVANTGLYGLTQADGHAILDQAEEQLKTLAAFALFATFERTLRDHLSNSLDPLADAVTAPSELAAKLHDFVKDGVDRWRIDHVIELFGPPAEDEDVNKAKAIRDFRNRIAHGATLPNAIPPKTAYEQLTCFLRNAGLVSK